MDQIVKAIVDFTNWLWGPPLMIILAGGGLFLTIRLGFFQFRHLFYMWGQTFGQMMKKPEDPNVISPFQAATAAIASTIGAANIVGVPVAIAFGGPGAVFWMWIIALLGCASKFSEIVLGIKYREKDASGEYVGGPTYYLAKGFKNKTLGKFLAGWFAFFLMIEIIPSISTQTVSAAQNAATLGIPDIATGIAMALIYVIGALVVIGVNIDKLPGVFVLIFESAFAPMAPVGGFAGSTLALALRWGAARGTYSNEAGMGTAPIAHATAQTDHPVRQGFWGIFEITLDTLIVCTVTALVVLVTGAWQAVPGDQAAAMPPMAFQTVFGKVGDYVVTISILLFVLSTVIVLVFYGERQARFLFGYKFSRIWKFIYIAAILFGVFGGLEFLYQFLDFFLALVILPNMIALIALSGEVRDLKNEFFTGEQYYLRDKARKHAKK